MSAGSSMSSVKDFMPGLAAVVSSSSGLAAAGDDDLVALLVEGFGEAAADAGTAAGDEDGVSCGVHASAPVCLGDWTEVG